MFALALGIAVPISGCDSLSSKSTKSKKSKKDKDDDDDDDTKPAKKKKKGSDDESTAESDAPADTGTAAPADTPPPATGEQFAGIYTSTYGEVRMRQLGTAVTGTYPGGKLTCTPTGTALDCDWKDNYGVGKAKLDKQASGDLKGTWGNGASPSNGGMWLFTLKSAGDPGPTGDEATVGSFAGDYISTYGTVTLAEAGGKVTGGYPGGTLNCVPSGAIIDCDWKDSSGSGKARLTRQATGNLDGTWGNGASNSNGGRWLFRKK